MFNYIMLRNNQTVSIVAGITLVVISLLTSYQLEVITWLPVQFPKQLSSVIRKFANNDMHHWMTSDSVGYHPFCPHRKARSFPHFSYPVTVPDQWRTSEDLTNETLTSFTVVNPRRVFRVCDELELFIQARDGRNQPKRYGGDYFRAKIFTQNDTFVASSSSDGEVVDHFNGTYSVYFTLKWAGKVNISVMLVHPSEAVYIIHKLREETQPRFDFRGLFISKDNATITEEVECNFLTTKMVDFCNYTDERTGSSWYCQKPKSPHLSCEDWKKHRLNFGRTINMAAKSINKTEEVAFKVAKIQIPGDVTEVIVHSQYEGDIHRAIKQLPQCTAGIHRNKPEVGGFYKNGVWYSPHCNFRRYDTGDSVSQCSADKTFYVQGDSTIRMVHDIFITKMNLTKVLRGPDNATHTSPCDGVDENNVTRTHFKFHYLPICQTRLLSLTNIDYVANDLDSIGDHDRVVIVISLWAHFVHAPKAYFEERMRSISEAAQRLHRRNPHVVVIIKGGNTRQRFKNPTFFTFSNDWYVRDLEDVLRNVISKTPNIGYLDAWDMTNAQLLPDEIHPKEPHGENLFHQIFSMICSK